MKKTSQEIMNEIEIKSPNFKLGKKCLECGKTHRKISALKKCYNSFISKGENAKWMKRGWLE